LRGRKLYISGFVLNTFWRRRGRGKKNSKKRGRKKNSIGISPLPPTGEKKGKKNPSNNPEDHAAQISEISQKKRIKKEVAGTIAKGHKEIIRVKSTCLEQTEVTPTRWKAKKNWGSPQLNSTTHKLPALERGKGTQDRCIQKIRAAADQTKSPKQFRWLHLTGCN